MTATPERTDGDDIFKMFDNNIAYEIRLHRALSEEMLSPFHYYGVTDLTINDQEVDELTDFNHLTAKERVERIIETAKIYGCDNGNVRGLIFSSNNEISIKLSNEFNERGFQTIALTGDSSEAERQRAIRLLESENYSEKLDYIFTVDIFNEGIDIPSVNQIIMLRPTQSAIIFVQQLGRGLRKIDAKDYLTVIDFIGNYNNNYLVPIALYGDRSYNKDALRKLISSGSSLIPGCSTINFDRISKDKIFESIDSANMQMKKDLVQDYNLLKRKMGRIPMMIDFINHGSRDPQLYVNYSKSYFNFVAGQEDFNGRINEKQKKLLELFSNEINNSKRIEETILLKNLILNESVDLNEFKTQIKNKYAYILSDSTLNSCVRNLNFEFVTENKDKKLKSAREIYGLNIVRKEDGKLIIENDFLSLLKQDVFKDFLLDNIAFALKTYDAKHKPPKFIDGFELYQKYTRKDVFRILNWEQNPLAQNVGGYMISSDKSNCPIFVNYKKNENISSTTKYEDKFVSPSKFEWMSKNKRRLTSPDVIAIRNAISNNTRLPLFIKKSNDEGLEFYFMGDVTPIDESFEETMMKDDNGNDVSVVKIDFKMNTTVEDGIYDYLTSV